MRNKIALEKHFAIDLTIDQSKGYAPSHVWEMLKSNLMDIEQQRLEGMERNGVFNFVAQLAWHPGDSGHQGRD
jgi:gamma-resorcylate decarboxylase